MPSYIVTYSNKTLKPTKIESVNNSNLGNFLNEYNSRDLSSTHAKVFTLRKGQVLPTDSNIHKDVISHDDITFLELKESYIKVRSKSSPLLITH